MDSQFLEQLNDPAVFPGSCDSVSVLQTHLSVVCLAGNRAYKIKKPLKLEFVDYSTLERREHFCEEEVRLNRRLCPDVYLRVVPFLRLCDGRLHVGQPGEESSGEIIEYAVEMVRLPGERMLDQLLEEDAVTPEHVREVAARVAAFHEAAERGVEVDASGDPENLARFALANFKETRNAAGRIFHADLHRKLEEKTGRDFERLMSTLRRRVGEGRVVDGHGDLHARNICLSDPMAIYDCIEFNRNFRCSDTALENAFLVMDLQFRGHPELAEVYLDAYARVGHDDEQRGLMPTFVRYRAMVRAKVAAIASGEGEMSGTERASSAEEARRYFHFSAASAIEEDGPWVVIACGLPGSGKSYTCRLMKEETGWPVFGSDRIRKELAGVAFHEPLDSEHYSEDFSRKTYEEMIERGVETAGESGVVLLDANFRTRALRRMAESAARARNGKLAILLADTPEPLSLARLGERTDGNREASDADAAVYRLLKSEFERPEPGEADRLVVLEGKTGDESPVPAILSALLG